MGTILGDMFKKVGGGLGKVFDGEIIDGVGDVLGGVIKAGGRTVNGALNLFGLGEETVDPNARFLLGLLAMLAKLAKADGRVSRQETQYIGNLLDAWGVEGEAKKNLQKFCNEQKQNVEDIFDFAEYTAQAAIEASSDDEGAAGMLIEAYRQLFTLAIIDDEIDDAEIAILRAIPPHLHLNEEIFELMAQELAGDGGEGDSGSSSDTVLAEAYATLGISPDASDAEVRNAWKKKMAAFHPDKIQGKDLDPEWLELANQKSAEINQAYETIKASRR